jgi:hypothetical protein
LDTPIDFMISADSQSLAMVTAMTPVMQNCARKRERQRTATQQCDMGAD